MAQSSDRELFGQYAEAPLPPSHPHQITDAPDGVERGALGNGMESSEECTSPLGFNASWSSPKRRQYLWQEAADQLELGLPIAGTYVLDFLMQTVSLSFVGHLGTLPLAAAAMASSLINITGFSFLVRLVFLKLCPGSPGCRMLQWLDVERNPDPFSCAYSCSCWH